jgi:hypothetical protein
MLILKVFVNSTQIDEVRIHNTGCTIGDYWHDHPDEGVRSMTAYRIRRPEGHEGTLVPHRPEDGWRVLARKVLEVMATGKDEARTRRAEGDEGTRGAHMSRLAEAFLNELTHLDYCGYGGIGIDCGRPFGNSDVEGDILGIAGLAMEGDDGEGPCWSSGQREYAAGLYRGLPDWLRANVILLGQSYQAVGSPAALKSHQPSASRPCPPKA